MNHGHISQQQPAVTKVSKETSCDFNREVVDVNSTVEQDVNIKVGNLESADGNTMSSKIDTDASEHNVSIQDSDNEQIDNDEKNYPCTNKEDTE